MQLLIDQGNTRLKWMLIGAKASVRLHGVFDYRSHSMEMLAQQLQRQCPSIRHSLTHFAVASVAGKEQLSLLRDFSEKTFQLEARVAQTETQWRHLRNSYEDVSKMGVDRWLACIGAEAMSPKKAKLIVDAGSAITVECVSVDGVHLGGYIGPGLHLLQSSLLGNTANIQAEVRLHSGALAPGKNTQDAVSAAAVQMTIGLVTGALKEMQKIDKGQSPQIIFTGGDGETLQSYFSSGVLSPFLVLDGLAARFAS